MTERAMPRGRRVEGCTAGSGRSGPGCADGTGRPGPGCTDGTGRSSPGLDGRHRPVHHPAGVVHRACAREGLEGSHGGRPAVPGPGGAFGPALVGNGIAPAPAPEAVSAAVGRARG